MARRRRRQTRTGALQSSAAAGSRTGLAGTRRARVGRRALGTVGVRAGARPRQARCALRPGLHGAAGLSRTGGAGDPRRLLLRAPRVVHRPGRPPAPADHRVGGPPGARGAGALGLLGARDRALHRGARIARQGRPSRRPRGRTVVGATTVLGAVRRLAVPAPADRCPDRCLRAAGGRASRGPPRHRRREPHRAARGLHRAGRRARAGRPAERAPLGGRRDAGDALRASDGVCVPLRIRGLRLHATRGVGPWGGAGGARHAGGARDLRRRRRPPHRRAGPGRRPLAAALGRLLADPAARTPYLAAAPTVLANYRWAETAARTWRYLEEAAGA